MPYCVSRRCCKYDGVIAISLCFEEILIVCYFIYFYM